MLVVRKYLNLFGKTLDDEDVLVACQVLPWWPERGRVRFHLRYQSTHMSALQTITIQVSWCDYVIYSSASLNC